jgi:hypothetical protein
MWPFTRLVTYYRTGQIRYNNRHPRGDSPEEIASFLSHEDLQ